MNRQRILGAIAFPTYLLMWSLGVVLVVIQLQAAGAAERWLPAWEPASALVSSALSERALAPVPSLNDADAMRKTAAMLVGSSEVMNGSWQPDEDGSAGSPAVSAPVVVDEPADARTGPLPVVPAAAVDSVEEPAPAQQIGTVGRAQSGVSDPVGTIDDAALPAVRKRPAASVSLRHHRDKAEARRALQSGRFAEAYARLRPAVGDARGDTEFLGLLGLAAMRTGNPAEAVVIYQHLSAMEPDTPRWRVGFALAQESLGLDASGVYREALALSDAGSEVRALLQMRLDGGGPAGVT